MLRRTSFDGQKLFSLISRNLKVETSQPDLDSSLIEPKTIQGKNLVQPTQVTFYLFVGNYLSIHPQPHTNFANLHAQAPIPPPPPPPKNKHTLPEQNDFYVGILGSIPRSYYLALFLLLIFIYQECNLIHTHAYIYIYIHIYIYFFFFFLISLKYLYHSYILSFIILSLMSLHRGPYYFGLNQPPY